MLAVLDEGLDGQLPERIESDGALDFAAEVEDARDFHYRWAHVIVTTAVLDTLRSVRRFCNRPGALRGGKRVKQNKGEVCEIATDIAELIGVDIYSYAEGLGILKGMVLARNKIVHNGALVKEQGKELAPIAVEEPGTELAPIAIEEQARAESSKPDAFAGFPEYIAGGFVRVTREVFDRNQHWCSAFLVWIDQQDLGNQLRQRRTESERRSSPDNTGQCHR